METAEAWAVLGLKPGATEDQIKTAYRDMARLMHPDHHPERDQQSASAMMRRLTDARDVALAAARRGPSNGPTSASSQPGPTPAPPRQQPAPKPRPPTANAWDPAWDSLKPPLLTINGAEIGWGELVRLLWHLALAAAAGVGIYLFTTRVLDLNGQYWLFAAVWFPLGILAEWWKKLPRP